MSVLRAEPKGGPVAGEGRTRIMDEAACRFLDAGYAETSLRDVAAGAGMKAGSLYYHFDSKETLLFAILERGMIFMVEAFDTVVAVHEQRTESGAPPSAYDRLADHVAAHLSSLHANRPYTAGHVTVFRTAPEEVRHAVVPLRDTYEARWTSLLARLLPDRSSEDITMLRLALFGSMNASIEWLDTGRGTVDRFARLVAGQFWYGANTAANTTNGSQWIDPARDQGERKGTQ